MRASSACNCASDVASAAIAAGLAATNAMHSRSNFGLIEKISGGSAVPGSRPGRGKGTL
jgi:hypothetical protein